jgi:hypothetical protein
MMKLFNRLIDFFELRKRGCHLLCQGPVWKILSYKAKKMSVYCDTLTFSNMNALWITDLQPGLVQPVVRLFALFLQALNRLR